MYVDIRALQISLLAGRLFFKGLRYHGHNETIIIHDGYITWRYWLRRVHELDCYELRPKANAQVTTESVANSEDEQMRGGKNREVEESSHRKRLPCRVLITSRGVEWFIYNRTSAYDAVLKGMTDADRSEAKIKDAIGDTTYSNSPLTAGGNDSTGFLDKDEVPPMNSNMNGMVNDTYHTVVDEISSRSSTEFSTSSSASVFDHSVRTLPSLLNILPITIECSKGAIVMGNSSTRSILTAKFEGATGQVGALQSRPADQYKQTIDVDLTHPVISFKHNKDFKQSRHEKDVKLVSESSQQPESQSHWFHNLACRKRIGSLWSSIRELSPYHIGSVESLAHPRPRYIEDPRISGGNGGAYRQQRWLGLSRYLEDDDDLIEQERWKAIEYGETPTVLDSPKIAMTFYWDVPGLVPSKVSSVQTFLGTDQMDINGEPPPDWGINLKIQGGIVNYGPWADRQRADLQAVFFPTLYKDVRPAMKLLPGQWRVSTVLKVVIDIEEQMTLRVPTREDSKDWKWKGHGASSAATNMKKKRTKGHVRGKKHATVNQSPEMRPFGWLDVRISPDSTVNFTMDLVARPDGYSNIVDLDLRGIEMLSSINHALLWRSRSQTISCNLSNPLEWNAMRQWSINVRDNGLELFLLRDHMFLLTDLINDWTSGLPGEFYTFVPFEYSINLHFADFKFYLNANESNIINNPSDIEDNTFIVVWGQFLQAHLSIPATTFRPARNQIKFEIEANDVGLLLRTPLQNTQHTFMNNPDVAALERLIVDGSYSYSTSMSPHLTDVLLLNLHGVSPKIKCFGFLIRFLMKFKDNYFGDDLHFRTLEEYQYLVNKVDGRNSVESSLDHHVHLSNDLDVILEITMENSRAVLPAGLYAASKNIELEISTILADLRITNYYMDLSVSSSPITFSCAGNNQSRDANDFKDSPPQMFVNGLEFNGHRLFGLPPAEPTYMCNWDFNIGCSTGECSIEFLRDLTVAMKCFALSYDDAENALPPFNSPVVHDVTFLRARIEPVLLGLRLDEGVFLLSTGILKVDYNDWAGDSFSSGLYMQVPNLTFAVAEKGAALGDWNNRNKTTRLHASVKSTFELKRVQRKSDFQEDRLSQQNHVALHDIRTCRTPWLIHRSSTGNSAAVFFPAGKVRQPAMMYPSIPKPVAALNNSHIGNPSSATQSTVSIPSKTSSRRRSSFLAKDASKEGDRFNGSNLRMNSHQRRAGSIDSHLSKAESRMKQRDQKRMRFVEPSGFLEVDDDALFMCTNAPDNQADSGFVFSSPYKRPHFQLLTLQLDACDMPALPETLPSDVIIDDTTGLELSGTAIPDKHAEQSSFMISLSQGIQIFCTSEALFFVTRLLAYSQTNDVATLLDILQVDTMTDVLSTESKLGQGSQITEARIFVPCAKARFVNQDHCDSKAVTQHECYDITLHNVAITIRLVKMVLKHAQFSTNQQFSSHVCLDEIQCSGRESTRDTNGDQAVISLIIREPLLWIFHGTGTSAELQLKDLEITSASRNVDYISSLVCRSMMFYGNLAGSFSKLEQERKSRLQFLVLLLTLEGEDVPDPPFLTKASYVMRSGSYHLRTNDSWKMMSRLRYIYHCLPNHSRDEISAQSTYSWRSCPRDAPKRVTSSFDHWRTWDLAQVRSSLLMQRVYGRSSIQILPVIKASIPLTASIRIGNVRVCVEPGPDQNEIVIEEFSVGLETNQTLPAIVGSPARETSVPMISTCQVYCVKIALRLNWSLCDLVENIAETLKATRSSYSENDESQSITHSSPKKHYLHIVMSSESSILTFESVNVKVVSLCQGYKISTIALQGSRKFQQSVQSVLSTADVATSEIWNSSTKLTVYKLRGPTVFGSRDNHMTAGVVRPWKFVGSGQGVAFQILANPLDMIEATDKFLEMEVARFTAMVRNLRPAERASQSPITATEEGILQAHVALFLDSYLISVAVLPSLSYQIAGTGARTSFTSGIQSVFEVALDFDIKSHCHVFKTGVSSESKELSTLRIPPINGRLCLDLTPKQKSVLLRILIERIIFDASAVHAMFTAITRPEIASLRVNLEQGYVSIHDHYEDVFGSNRPENKLPLSEPVLYDIHVTLESLTIQASTFASSSTKPEAQLHCVFSRISVKTTNTGSGRGGASRLPELHLRLKSINLNLTSFDGLEAHPRGEIAIEAYLRCTTKLNGAGESVRSYQVRSNDLEIDVYAGTAPAVVAILGHLQDTFKTTDLSHDVQSLKRLGRERLRHEPLASEAEKNSPLDDNPRSVALFGAMYSLEMTNIRARWRVETSVPILPAREAEDLTLSFRKVDLATKRDNAARLLIEDFQLQMVPASRASTGRSLNSALLPEVVFNVAYLSTAEDRRLACQAAGKSLDLRLTSHFIVPASDLRRSITFAAQQLRTATTSWRASAPVTEDQGGRLFGNKKFASLLVDADFAGAVVYVQGRNMVESNSLARDVLRGGRSAQHARYNQFTPDNSNSSHATLRAPGIAFKVQYKNTGLNQQSFNAEIKVDASSNILYPTVVPLIMEISSSIKEIAGEPRDKKPVNESKYSQSTFLGDGKFRAADPSAILGNCRVNLGLRICEQEFSLSCQPVARVTATARFKKIYFTVNSIQSPDHGKFFTISAAFTRLQASVQHVYSRDPTGSFDVDSIVISFMNSKHITSANGISAILKISPMSAQINAKQSQDFLLFREIWVPSEIRQSDSTPSSVPASESQVFNMQRYRQVAAAYTFPWNATVSIVELDVQLDLGQSLGKSAFVISDLWISSKKSSDLEQNLCLGFSEIAVNSAGRMSGFVKLQSLKVRTSIKLPAVEGAHEQTPLVQASLAFGHLRIKAAFDYQAFLIANIAVFEFLMYNVRHPRHVGRDRLVAILDGDKVQVFSTTSGAAQALALYQAFQRLMQEKQAAYESSLRDIEKHLRRKSSINPLARSLILKDQSESDQGVPELSLKLQTDVVVKLKVVNLGVFPNTFFDIQIFKSEVLDASARFAAILDNERIHSSLGMTLGQLRIALSDVNRANVPRTLGEVSVDDVVASATTSRGGTILNVPKLVATMQTWQFPEATQIDYIFRSSFQGKVDVGWNYSRISYIRGMWTKHARALAQRLGKPLPPSAVQITGGPQPEGGDEGQKVPEGGQEKITAVVSMPLSKYQYTPLQPPVIETPQLRDMGEATPPLEWIGLHRDRLPNLTHQIVIVTLLEIAKEVDNAYSRILGSY